jgi:hypothetical protein
MRSRLALGAGDLPAPAVAAQNAAPRGQLGIVSGGVAFHARWAGAIGVAAASALVLGRRPARSLGRADHEPRRSGARRTFLEARPVARAFGVMFARSRLPWRSGSPSSRASKIGRSASTLLLPSGAGESIRQLKERCPLLARDQRPLALEAPAIAGDAPMPIGRETRSTRCRCKTG